MPFSPSYSSRQLRQQIENFAPREYYQKREEFYTQLRDLGRGIYKFVLGAIVVANDLYQSELAQERAKVEEARKKEEGRYWQERDEIEKQLENITQNDVVRRFNSDIEFYDPGEVNCPHGRRRKRCEEFHGQLALLTELEKPPLNKYVRRHIQELKEQLKREGIDRLNQRPSDFCVAHPVDHSPKMPSIPPPKSTGGRPRKQLQNYLLETVVGCVTRAGATDREGCGFVAQILMYCFGKTPKTHHPRDNPFYTLCDSVEKQWARLQPGNQSTKNIH